jgi:hypothetical protein
LRELLVDIKIIFVPLLAVGCGGRAMYEWFGNECVAVD